MPGREYQAQPSRFGFNGKENDNDVKGFGNQQDYGMRIYDARIGRFLSVDPLTRHFPWFTPYQFAGNNPISFIDLDGKEPVPPDRYSKSSLLQNPDYVGLTLTMLRQQTANELGISILDWRTNVAAGSALESAFSDFSDRFPNGLLFSNSYRKSAVRPDFVANRIGRVRDANIPAKEIEPPIKLFNGLFIEVKATSQPIDLSTSKGQIGGMIDALSKLKTSRGGTTQSPESPGLAELIFVVPYGTEFSKGLVAEASAKGVQLYVSYAFQNINSKGITFSNAEPLNITATARNEVEQHSNRQLKSLWEKIRGSMKTGKLEIGLSLIGSLFSNEKENNDAGTPPKK